MNKVILYIAGTIIYYFITVMVLHIMMLILNDSFENIWLSAIPITITAELMLFIYYLWKKYKKS